MNTSRDIESRDDIFPAQFSVEHKRPETYLEITQTHLKKNTFLALDLASGRSGDIALLCRRLFQLFLLFQINLSIAGNYDLPEDIVAEFELK